MKCSSPALRVQSICSPYLSFLYILIIDRWIAGDDVLALPKLNLQFLSFYDYLLRCFTLYRLESAYEIRADIVDAVKRSEWGMRMSWTPSRGVRFHLLLPGAQGEVNPCPCHGPFT